MTACYFATDGAVGLASGLVVVDVSGWTDADWDEMNAASDWDRADVARTIASEKKVGTA